MCREPESGHAVGGSLWGPAGWLCADQVLPERSLPLEGQAFRVCWTDLCPSGPDIYAEDTFDDSEGAGRVSFHFPSGPLPSFDVTPTLGQGTLEVRT